jgi:hypothetical protein
MDSNYCIILAKLYFNEDFLVDIIKSGPQGQNFARLRALC